MSSAIRIIFFMVLSTYIAHVFNEAVPELGDHNPSSNYDANPVYDHKRIIRSPIGFSFRRFPSFRRRPIHPQHSTSYNYTNKPSRVFSVLGDGVALFDGLVGLAIQTAQVVDAGMTMNQKIHNRQQLEQKIQELENEQNTIILQLQNANASTIQYLTQKLNQVNSDKNALTILKYSNLQ